MDKIVLDRPPDYPEPDGLGGGALTALPLLGSVASVGLLAGMGSARMWGVAAVVLLSTCGLVAAQAHRQRTLLARRLARGRGGYVRHLAEVRDRLRATAAAQRDRLTSHHPGPAALAVRGSSPLEPLQGLGVRVGLADAALEATIEAPDPGDRSDPLSTDLLRRLVTTHRRVPRLPRLVDLVALDRIDVHAPTPEAARSLVRAVVCNALGAHGPGRLRVEVYAADTAPWTWLAWAPHARSESDSDNDSGHLLVVCDGQPPPTGLPRRATVVRVADASLAQQPTGPRAATWTLSGDGRLDLGEPRCEPGRPTAENSGAADVVADTCSPVTAEAVARRLAAGAGPADETVSDLVADHGRLRVAMGRVGEGRVGAPVVLDLNEAAAGGVGPHGLVVGATGSGKSELLRTLVLGLAARHSPDDVHLALVDFKGGATFAPFADLPHVAALVTNLADDLALVDRLHAALDSELRRRQHVLRDGGHGSVAAHARARRAGADLSPLPSLVVVVDEYAELLAARPELAETFEAIGRLGRSLGLHLVLASQRVDEGRWRGLTSHLSYRVALRAFSLTESRAALGTSDAFDLPAEPGWALLQAGTSSPVRFRIGHVSAPAPRACDTIEPVSLAPPLVAVATGPSQLEVLTKRLAAETGPRAHPIWLPPLDRPDSLDHWLGAPGIPAEPLVLPVGRVDRPTAQRHDPLLVDLARGSGHVAVIGSARSGRTTALQTMVAAACLRTGPSGLGVAVADPGLEWADLADLPHVEQVATGPDAVRRLLREVAARLADRVTTPGRLLLVIDGWSGLRASHPDLEPALQFAAEHGPALGVHVLLSASRWGDLRPALRDLLHTRLELRLGDPMESAVDRQAAARVPLGRPGRGLADDGAELLVALPRVDGSNTADDLQDGRRDLVRQVHRTWRTTAL